MTDEGLIVGVLKSETRACCGFGKTQEG